MTDSYEMEVAELTRKILGAIGTRTPNVAGDAMISALITVVAMSGKTCGERTLLYDTVIDTLLDERQEFVAFAQQHNDTK